jgi:hypothetical protein
MKVTHRATSLAFLRLRRNGRLLPENRLAPCSREDPAAVRGCVIAVRNRQTERCRAEKGTLRERPEDAENDPQVLRGLWEGKKLLEKCLYRADPVRACSRGSRRRAV